MLFFAVVVGGASNRCELFMFIENGVILPPLLFWKIRGIGSFKYYVKSLPKIFL
jgi:hypothetical protein